MAEDFVLAAQLSTSHSAPDALEKNRVLDVLRQALDVAPLDILILGCEEMPDLYQALTAPEADLADEIYLWYPLLSDYPGIHTDHLMLNHQGTLSQGWGDFAASGEISETFRFACPNNPDALKTTLSHLERLLRTYNFDGVFLDKFRFPSPANGLQEMFSCFCGHCRRAARERGFNLDEVKEAIESLTEPVDPQACNITLPGAQWLEVLLAHRPAVQEFIRFRCDSITQTVIAVRALTDLLDKKLAFDVFSPSLAPLVGQDYARIARYGVWAKPMIYRFAKGPAGLRLEVPALAGDLAQFLGCGVDKVVSWFQQHVPGLIDTDLERIASEGVPLDLIADETRQAVKLMAPAPVYLGVETVSMPGIIDITPQNVKEIVNTGCVAGARGVVLSWDIMHTPVDNLQPLEAVV